ncbi:MAG TPA: VWA domain-containing protein [Candidatus Rikenella faecigallinarum]|uniref:VWA domain-containing protein n=1 Tax=Candidatus Rikenella faecigallinarum TaxID=2838745 RepID=A0A9D1TYL5_9BACT|nr:VWA domain-containing protein [Candidatus Rikenella faecigallinarum]
MLDIVRFENPRILWLLLLLVPMVAYYVYRTLQGRAAIQVSTVSGLLKLRHTYRYWLRHAPFVLRLLVVALVIFAMARPQSSEESQNVNAEGIDIVMALDISGSMLARDFSPDRLTAAQDIGSKFIIARPTDRIGLVVFAGEAFTQSPITTDHVSLVNLMNQIKSGMIADGTAIGNGLATAVNRLKESDAPSKVIILLTDGVNNSGQIDPLTAAQIAADYGIRVYTIGVGSEGVAPTPTINEWGGISFVQAKVEIDEDILRQIADKTGGRYFRATDNTKLAEIYAEIDQLEKTKVEVENFVKYSEVYHFWLLLAVGLLMLEMLSRYLFLRQIP